MLNFYPCMLTGSTPDAALFIGAPSSRGLCPVYCSDGTVHTSLPVAQYLLKLRHHIIIISVSYPEAGPEVMNTSVVSLIEREISSVDNLSF